MAPSVLRLRHVLRLQVITVVTFGCAVLYCIQSINEMILAPNCFDPCTVPPRMGAEDVGTHLRERIDHREICVTCYTGQPYIEVGGKTRHACPTSF